MFAAVARTVHVSPASAILAAGDRISATLDTKLRLHASKYYTIYNSLLYHTYIKANVCSAFQRSTAAAAGIRLQCAPHLCTKKPTALCEICDCK